MATTTALMADDVDQGRIDDVARRPHAAPPVVDVRDEQFDLGVLPRTSPADPAFVRAAGHNTRRLPAAVHDALIDFADAPPSAGALLLRGIPVGAVPATPPHPTASLVKDAVSEFMLLTVARTLGQPVGYLPEHGGDVLQNILPVQGTEKRQVSTSSKVELMFHTEAAFHPHRPRYLLLLCLRGDRDGLARTTLSSIREVAPLLDERLVDVLAQPRFRTAPDESYVGGRSTRLGSAGARAHRRARRAVPHLRRRPDDRHGSGGAAGPPDARRRGRRAPHRGRAHGRRPARRRQRRRRARPHPVRPRFDGTDRWLQRTFVVADLAASAGERLGRVITTRFELTGFDAPFREAARQTERRWISRRSRHRPARFASDNSAGVHPRVLDALAEANEGHALAYGYDAVTRRRRRALRRPVRSPGRRLLRVERHRRQRDEPDDAARTGAGGRVHRGRPTSTSTRPARRSASPARS